MMELVAEINCNSFSEGGWVKNPVYVPREMQLEIYVNGQHLANILCTPIKLDYLVMGYLFAEGIISDIDDVARMQVSEKSALADIRLRNSEFTLPMVPTLASGCGGDGVFVTEGEGVESSLVVAPEEIIGLMKKLEEKMELYRLSGGVHTSALADTKNLLVVAEDIGRHNTLNKIQGECLLEGIQTKDRLVLITGRISSEMLLKAAKMQAPVVVSRHSPTSSAILLARKMGIALVGEARGNRLTVFTHPERLGNLRG
ncbi:MAG: formate dehydrogenase accessory sulfurtransferase FdhD [Dethiobacteria bacterium]